MPRTKPHFAPHGAEDRNRRSRAHAGMIVLVLLIVLVCMAWLIAAYVAPPF